MFCSASNNHIARTKIMGVGGGGDGKIGLGMTQGLVKMLPLEPKQRRHCMQLYIPGVDEAEFRRNG